MRFSAKYIFARLENSPVVYIKIRKGSKTSMIAQMLSYESIHSNFKEYYKYQQQ